MRTQRTADGEQVTCRAAQKKLLVVQDLDTHPSHVDGRIH